MPAAVLVRCIGNMKLRDRSAHYLFYCRDLSGDCAELDPSETRHAVNVLRMKLSSEIMLTDGSGCRAAGEYVEIHEGKMIVSIRKRAVVTRPSPFLTLCTGIPERDAFEEILINAAALGVGRIIPCEAALCQKPWWKSAWKKLQPRFTRKMITALKQSHGVYLPELAVPAGITEIIEELPGTFLVADQHGPPLHTVSLPGSSEQLNCVIGPPGGFSGEELDLFKEKSYLFVKVAPSRLRTELAATVLCAQLIGYTI